MSEQTKLVEAAGSADVVNHPPHYTSHPSGIECIQITEHYGFCVGNAIKYLWRSGLKGDAVEDLKKARWYLDREITRRELNHAAGSATDNELHDSLCGEILATLRSNMISGRMTTEDDVQFGRMINEWSARRLGVKFEEANK